MHTRQGSDAKFFETLDYSVRIMAFDVHHPTTHQKFMHRSTLEVFGTH